nr:MAG TPA: hypothetical protein [Caudoviricetes sp.]
MHFSRLSAETNLVLLCFKRHIRQVIIRRELMISFSSDTLPF